jgi:hypothetical protein
MTCDICKIFYNDIVSFVSWINDNDINFYESHNKKYMNNKNYNNSDSNNDSDNYSDSDNDNEKILLLKKNKEWNII